MNGRLPGARIAAAGLLACTALGAHGGARAEQERAPARRVSLRELLAVASRQSPVLAEAGVVLAISRGAELERRGVDDLVLSSSVEYRTTRSPPLAGQPVQVLRSDTWQAVTTLALPLPTGGELRLELDGRREQSLSQLLGSDGSSGEIDGEGNGDDTGDDTGAAPFELDQYSVAPTLELRHPLLRGAGRAVARAERRRAELAVDGAALQQRAVATEVLLGVADGYWQLAHAAQMLRLRRKAVELADAELRTTRAAVRSGALAQSSERAVRHRLALREQAVIKAEAELTERSLALRRLAGLEIGPGELDLDPQEPLSFEPRDFDADQTLATVLAVHPRLAAAETAVARAAVATEVTRDAALPRIDVTARAGPRGTAENLGAAFDQIAGLDNVELSARLELGYEIPLRAARGSRARSAQELEQTRLAREELRRELAVATIQGVNRVRMASQQVELSQRALELAESNVDDERARFKVGRSTIFDVLDRLDEFEEARASQADALLEHRRAVLLVDSFTGALIERLGVSVGFGG